METQTEKEQQKKERFIPDEKFTGIIVQNLYDSVHERKKSGKVGQAYGNLHDVIEDQNVGIEGARLMGIDKFGDVEEYQFIVNKNPETYNVTGKDMSNFILGIFKMLKKSPESKFFGMLLYAGHGMIRDGRQNFLLNQFDKKKGFYQLSAIEENFRGIPAKYMNSYMVGIVACCREIYIKERHCNCVGAIDSAEATKIFEEKEAAEKMKQNQTLSLQQENEELKKQLKEKQAIIDQQASEEEDVPQDENEETKQEA